MWHEAVGDRGGDQIASCLFKFIKAIPGHDTELTFYSDTCTGQNKNSFMAAIFLTAIQNPSLQIINHKYLVSGYSHMECDIVHAVIERKKKNPPTC